MVCSRHAETADVSTKRGSPSMEPALQLSDLGGERGGRAIDTDIGSHLVDRQRPHRCRGDIPSLEPVTELRRRAGVDHATRSQPLDS